MTDQDLEARATELVAFMCAEITAANIRAGKPEIIRSANAIKAVSAALSETEMLREAANKVIEMNLQHAQDQYGDASKAETWACVRVLREALEATRHD